MLAYWPYILLALLLLVLVTAAVLYLVLLRASRRAEPKQAAPAPAPVRVEDPSTAGLFSPLAALGLKASFSGALKKLRAHVTHRDFRYRLPWYLMVGESGAGKSTALGESGMKSPLGRPQEHRDGVKQRLNWFFFDRGVVLDVSGEMVLRRDGETPNQRGWDHLARLLQRHRPERPLDGVVLTIPATELLSARGLEGRARIEHKAACLYRKLWQAQKLLGMSFPVYVLVTKCDEVTGFQTLCQELPASARDEMFGWSSPYTLETVYRPEWVEEAFQNVYRYLFELQVEVFAEHGDVQDRDGLFLLPSEMQRLKAPLQLYLDQVFKESSFHESFFFRGLYFCGDAGADAHAQVGVPVALPAGLPPADVDADGLLAYSPDAASPEADDDGDGLLAFSPDPFAKRPKLAAPAPGPRRPAFVKDLFEKKIFAEDVLARPLARTALSRNRRVLAAQLLSIAIPLVGLVGLLFTFSGLQRRSDNLYNLLMQEEQDLREVLEASNRPASVRPGESENQPVSQVSRPSQTADAATAEARAANAGGARFIQAAYFQPGSGEEGAGVGESGRGAAEPSQTSAPDNSRDNEQHLLSAMAKSDAKNYYSFFIPTSWFSPLEEETTESLVGGFKYVILENLRLELRKRTDDFLGVRPIIYDSYGLGPSAQGAGARPYAASAAAAAPPPPEGRGASPVYDKPFRPGEAATLRGLIEEFSELQLNRERYAGLAEGNGTLEDLRGLVLYLGHAWPKEEFDPNNELYLTALQRARTTGLRRDADSVQHEFSKKVLLMVEAIYERSFERPAGVVRYDYISDIAQTQALVSRPEYTWLATQVYTEPHSPFFDMTLSSGLGELRKALEDLSRESFMGATPGRAYSSRQMFLRRQLVWDADALRQALALCADYERFEGDRNAYSRRLDDAVKRAALTQLQAKVAALVAGAQRYEPGAQMPGESARRATLAAEVRGLQQAQEPLSQLLSAVSRLQLDVGLKAALANQSAYLVGSINGEFQAGHFYSMARSDFDWWDGRGPVSSRAFGADNPDALAVYLASERKRIAFLARDLALPVFTFMNAHGIPTQPLRTDSRVEWDEILTELDRFDNKQPGNSISTLEDFIRTGMDKASVPADASGDETPVPDCDSLASGDGASLDFFIRTRNSLRRMLRGRCLALAAGADRRRAGRDEEAALKGLDDYREIADRFNQKLADRFPFAEAPGGVPVREAEPADLLAFFALFDKREAAAREALARNSLGTVAEDASRFLDRIAEVRRFFAQYVEKKQGPFVDFQLQFRSNREMESPGARQIIDWTLDVGRRKYGYRDQELTGRWVAGEPVRLTLRWAANSPVVPNVAPDTATLRARDRVATFDFRSRWSLLAMLKQQAASGGDFQYGVDTLPYTLKFVVPTTPDGDRSDIQPSELRGEYAQVFMSFTLTAPGTKEPLVVPDFPKWAPKF
jgi:type VI secretion system protein ImpL